MPILSIGSYNPNELAENMKGYNCIRWDDNYNQYLTDNYLTLTNEKMGNALGRTGEAVRKQLNVLLLKRPKKTEVRTFQKKARKDFFNILGNSLDRRRELERIRKKLEKRQVKDNNEKTWAKKFTAKPATVILTEPVYNGEKVRVHIDHRTYIDVPAHRAAAVAEKYKHKAIPK